MDTFLIILITVILFLILGIITKYLKFPFILGVIFASFILHPFVSPININEDLINNIKNILISVIFFGYTLFLKNNGKGLKNLFNSLINQFILLLLTYIIFSFIGFDTFESLFLATVVSLSSPLLSIQTLINHKQENTRYSQYNSNSHIIQSVVIGIFLIITYSLSILPEQFSNQQLTREVFLNIVKIGILTINAYLFSKFILPKILNLTKSSTSESQNLEFLLLLSWGISISYISHTIGLNYLIGAIIAGIILANTIDTTEVFKKFFSISHILFPVLILIVVSKIDFSYLSEKFMLILIILIVVLAVKPFINYLLVKFQGLSKREGFYFAISNETISEVSIILVLIATSNNLIPKDFTQLIYICYILSSIIFLLDRALIEKKYKLIEKKLNFFGSRFKVKTLSNPNKGFIIMGANETGYNILNDFKEIPGKILIIDSDQNKLNKADKLGYDTLILDLEDEESYDFIPWKDSKMIISCIDNSVISQKIIKKIKTKRYQGIVTLTTTSITNAIDFYRQGVDYIFMRDLITKYFITNFVNVGNISKRDLSFERSKHIEDLKQAINYE